MPQDSENTSSSVSNTFSIFANSSCSLLSSIDSRQFINLSTSSASEPAEVTVPDTATAHKQTTAAMMMLSPAAISSVVSTSAAKVFSPSAHPFMCRVGSRFRYDPYKAVASSVSVSSSSSTASSSGSTNVLASSAAIASSAAASAAAVPAIVAGPAHLSAASSTSAFSSFDASIAGSAVAAPTVTRIPSSAPRYAVVRSKHTSAAFLAPFKIAVGDVVVVEGDRGEDCGVVASITVNAPEKAPTAKVLRRARDADHAAIAAKAEREAEALAYAQSAAASVRLNATVTDVEYQLDMNKLTIFVARATATTFVDFRKLQRSLFKHYKCRIWCAYMDEVEA